ncbi:MAG: TIGR02266 family protein [Desulfuromonadales bacterium]|nr:TIGR02266 family protein [Desulfuromonadales bacterium]
MEKKVILLADATLFFIGSEKTFFLRDNFELRTAHSGPEVLEVVATSCPDIAFLDLNLPGMSGDECCHRIKTDVNLKHIPVIMVTEGVKQEDLQRCRRADCDGVIFKPINPDDVINIAKKNLHVQTRALPRYVARMRVHFGKDADQLFSEYTLNLSTGGVFLETTNLMAEGTPLVVEFVLPHRNIPISCKACVAWVNHPGMIRNPNLPAGMGIQFLDLNTESVEAIRSYIHEENLAPQW